MSDRIDYPQRLDVSLFLEKIWNKSVSWTLTWSELEEAGKFIEQMVEQHKADVGE